MIFNAVITKRLSSRYIRDRSNRCNRRLKNVHSNKFLPWDVFNLKMYHINRAYIDFSKLRDESPLFSPFHRINISSTVAIVFISPTLLTALKSYSTSKFAVQTPLIEPRTHILALNYLLLPHNFIPPPNLFFGKFFGLDCGWRRSSGANPKYRTIPFPFLCQVTSHLLY